MHSGVKPSSYEDTVAKAISNLIDIYRLLKIYTPDIPAVFAFVFPKIGTAHCVTQIECKFVANPPCFEVDTKPLNLGAVRIHILKVIKSSLLKFIQQAKLQTHINHSFFVRLSDPELEQFKEMVKATNTCTQVITSQSIVITDGWKYWKYIGQEMEAFRVQSLRRVNMCCTMNHYLFALNCLYQLVCWAL